MSSLAPITRLFHGFPMSILEMDGRRWLLANDLAGPLQRTARAVRLLVAKIDPSETSEVPLPTSNRGSQETLLVTEAGAAEVVMLSKSPIKRDFLQWLLESRGQAAIPVAADSRLATLETITGAQTTALQALHASQQALAANNAALTQRLERLETRAARKKAEPVRRAAVHVPDEEIGTFYGYWRRLTVNFEQVSCLARLCFDHSLMPTLLAACPTERSRTTVLGKWLTGRPEVERHRSSHRRTVRLRPGGGPHVQ